MDSILDSVKKVLGIEADYTVFDVDILMHINSTFAVLTQLGVGSPSGYYILDSSPVWNDYLVADATLNMVRSYMFIKVRLLFDPPGTSFHLNALEAQAKEYEWRLNVVRESVIWTDPNSTGV